MPKGSSSIRFMKQVGDGLMAFRQDKKAILTTADDELPTVIGECEAEGLEDIPPSMSAWLEETGREVKDYQSKPKPKPKGIIKAKAATGDTEPTKEKRVTVEPEISWLPLPIPSPASFPRGASAAKPPPAIPATATR